MYHFRKTYLAVNNVTWRGVQLLWYWELTPDVGVQITGSVVPIAAGKTYSQVIASHSITLVGE